MPQPNLQQRASFADFELLAEVSQLLTVLDLDSVLERAIGLTARAVGAEKASLFLHHQHSSAWQRILTMRNLDPQETLRVVEKVVDQGLAGWVVRERQAAVVYDTETDPRWLVFPNDTMPVRSALCVPLLQDGRVLAVLTLVHTEPNSFNEHQLRLVTIIANQVTIAVRNAQLFHQMEEQQRQLEAVLHAIPDVLLVVNQEGKVLLVNDPAGAVLNMPDEVAERTLNSLLKGDPAFDPLQTLFTDPSHQGRTFSFDTRSERLHRDFVVTVSPWDSRVGERAAGYVIVMHDVTTLRDLNRFKDEMLRLASHELRKPLALIIGYLDLVRMDTPPESHIHEFLEATRRSSERMNNLLDDLLRVERIRSSPLELRKAVNFSELLAKVADSMELLAGAKKQKAEIDAPPHLPDLVVDDVLVREAMENLVSNAIKYTAEGGHIKITVQLEDERVHFTVEDNGMGIAPADLPHVFESFYRGRQHTDVPVEGHGLGLSLVKTIIERHGGEVWAESELGVGSRFGFWLPLRESLD